jgi:aminopeptidase YwaD
MKASALLLLLLFPLSSLSQDSVYARKVISVLTSKKCFGRGYVRNGLVNAEKYIVSELARHKVRPLFSGGYTQPFPHSVNTFPRRCRVKVNGRRLKPGVDFIVDPGCPALKGKFILERKDSVTFTSKDESPGVFLTLKKKLTFSVAPEQDTHGSIVIDSRRFTREPNALRVKVDAHFVPGFVSRNIGCVVQGTTTSDSMVVFTAHYDHLGGMGRKTFFPGANDNASGVAMLLDLVRHYTAHPPSYTTAFIFFAAEEAGLMGSRFFTESGAIDLKKIKFLINLDLLGTGDDGIMVVNGAVHEREFNTLVQLNQGRAFVKEVRKRGKAANSDHYWFSEKGVPCFFIYTLGGISAYHDVFDRAETLPLTEYRDVFRLITAFAAGL